MCSFELQIPHADGEGTAKVEERFLQPIEIIGECTMAKLEAKERRRSEAAMLTHCNHWTDRGEGKEAKERRKAILRMGGAASLACAVARPPVVSKWSGVRRIKAKCLGQFVRSVSPEPTFAQWDRSGDRLLIASNAIPHRVLSVEVRR